MTLDTRGKRALHELDEMSVTDAEKLPVTVRSELLDFILNDAKKIGGPQPSRQIGLMCDWFEEDLARFQKVRAVKIRFGGFIPVDSDGNVPTLDPQAQFKLVFENMKATVAKSGSSMDRIVNAIIFMKNMDYWSQMNDIYRQYIKSSPTRAAIGCQDLNLLYQIEVVNVIAYKVAN